MNAKQYGEIVEIDMLKRRILKDVVRILSLNEARSVEIEYDFDPSKKKDALSKGKGPIRISITGIVADI